MVGRDENMGQTGDLTPVLMPLLFVGHGNPMNAISDNEFVEGWRGAAATIPRPQAILCISAHWETRGTFVTAMDHPETIHDFGGFPPQLYDVQYPAPGMPLMAAEVKDLATTAPVMPDYRWGLDHGCWSVIRHMYPDADIPVVQMSLDYTKDPRFHYDLAGELLPLRRKGVLIIGSGNMVHNLGLVDWANMDKAGHGYEWALEASRTMKELISEGNHRELIKYHSLGRAFDLAIPTAEHFLPLLYILALKTADESLSFFNDKAVGGSLTMTSLKIG